VTSALRVLVVDDEPLARRRLCRLLAAQPGVAVVGQAGDGMCAIALTAELRPDVVLLDIQMPAPSGIDVVARLPEPRPHVIFVTAFDRHAVRAFELQAADYLLKPVAAGRLAEAMARVGRGAHLRGAAPGFLQRIPVRRAGRVDLVESSAIEWIEAADNYVVVYTESGRYVVRDTLSGLVRLLDPARFMRVHRSVVVSLGHVQHLAHVARGDWTAHLKSGRTVPVSRTYRQALFVRLRAQRAG
jgi:two-component system LytT family response regulator